MPLVVKSIARTLPGMHLWHPVRNGHRVPVAVLASNQLYQSLFEQDFLDPRRTELFGLLWGRAFECGGATDQPRYLVILTDATRVGTTYSDAYTASITGEMKGLAEQERQLRLERVVTTTEPAVQYIGNSVVGSVHTHPNHGIFFSETDVNQMMKRAFRDPWQIGMVVDPRRRLGGYFFWDAPDEIDKAGGAWREFDLEPFLPMLTEHYGLTREECMRLPTPEGEDHERAEPAPRGRTAVISERTERPPDPAAEPPGERLPSAGLSSRIADPEGRRAEARPEREPARRSQMVPLQGPATTGNVRRSRAVDPLDQPPPTLSEEAADFVRQHPLMVTVGLISAIVAVAGVAGLAVWLLTRPAAITTAGPTPSVAVDVPPAPAPPAPSVVPAPSEPGLAPGAVPAGGATAAPALDVGKIMAAGEKPRASAGTGAHAAPSSSAPAHPVQYELCREDEQTWRFSSNVHPPTTCSFETLSGKVNVEKRAGAWKLHFFEPPAGDDYVATSDDPKCGSARFEAHKACVK